MAKSNFNAPQPRHHYSEGAKSKGILDDSPVRTDIATREGTVEKVPVNNSDIANKKYVDDEQGNHNIADHNDTTATGAELNTLTDNSVANTLHRHSELVASDGSPDPALSVDASGNVGIGTTSPNGTLEIGSGQILVPNGDSESPSFARSGSTNTGFFFKEPDNSLWFTSGGTDVWGAASGNVLGLSNNVRLGFSPGEISSVSADTYLKRTGVNELTLQDASSVLGTFITGKVGIGTTSPATSAKLDLTSTTGALLLSRMTTAQRDALTAVNGMILYNTTLNKVQVYEGGAWASVI